MALFFTISLCSPVVEGRAYCGSSFVRLSICLLVADVGGGIFRTPSHKEIEKKEAPPTYLPKRNKRLYQISQCVVNYCTTKVLLDLFHGGLFILQSFQISTSNQYNAINQPRRSTPRDRWIQFNNLCFRITEYQKGRYNNLSWIGGDMELKGQTRKEKGKNGTRKAVILFCFFWLDIYPS